MNSLAAITDRVFQQLEGGFVSDDSRLNIDLVRDKVLSVWAKAIERKYGSWVGALPDQLYQRCCIELECAEICGSGLARLSGVIPKLFGMLGSKNLRFVGTVDGTAYERRKSSGKRFELYQPFAQVRPSYRIIGDNIELHDAPMGLGVIVVEGVFIDPAMCPPCREDDQIFLPLPDIHDDIEIKVMQELQQIWMMRKVDTRNDAKPNN